MSASHVFYDRAPAIELKTPNHVDVSERDTSSMGVDVHRKGQNDHEDMAKIGRSTLILYSPGLL